jgi:serine/threonine protein kinase
MMTLEMGGEGGGDTKRARSSSAVGAAASAHISIRGISCRDATPEGVQGIVGGGVGVLPSVKRNAHLAAPVEVVLGSAVAAAVVAGGDFADACIHAPPADLGVFFSTPVAEGGGRGLLVDGVPQSHLQRRSYVVYEHWTHNLSGLSMEGVSLSAGHQQRIGFQLLRGVLRMHQWAFVHGAISPDVVCFARDGMVKLLPRPNHQRSITDFDLKQVAGILKEVGGAGTRTGQNLMRKSASTAVGAGGEGGAPRISAPQLQCMSPELLMGAAFVLPCSDAWSVACVLAHALIGRPLFPGTTRQEVLQSIVATVGPVTKRWPASRYLPLHSLVSPCEFQRSEAKKLGGTPAPQLEELLRASGVPKALSRLLRKMLAIDPAQRPDAKAALQNEYFKVFVPPSKPGIESLYSGAAAASAVKQRVAGTVLLSSFPQGGLISATTFRSSLAYSASDNAAVPPHNAGEALPEGFERPRVAGDCGPAETGEQAAEGDAAEVAVPVDIDPFPYLKPCVMIASDLSHQQRAQRAASWSASLPIVLAVSAYGNSSAASAATSGFGAGFA